MFIGRVCACLASVLGQCAWRRRSFRSGGRSHDGHAHAPADAVDSRHLCLHARAHMPGLGDLQHGQYQYHRHRPPSEYV